MALTNENEIHLWRIRLRTTHSPQEAAILSPEELAHALKFRCASAATTFIQSRAALKKILTGYLQIPCERVHIIPDLNGKPKLVGKARKLEFNVSHSGLLAIIAISSMPVGVDVERINPALNWRKLIPLCCHTTEAAPLLSLADEAGRIGFLRLWTCKEAVLKAHGAGLKISPKRVHFWVLDLLTLGFITDVADKAAKWHVQELNLMHRYLGALATQCNASILKYFDFAELL